MYSWPLETALAMQTESKPIERSLVRVMLRSPPFSSVWILPQVHIRLEDGAMGVGLVAGQLLCRRKIDAAAREAGAARLHLLRACAE